MKNRLKELRARDVQTLLAVGEEALRSPAVGAVLSFTSLNCGDRASFPTRSVALSV